MPTVVNYTVQCPDKKCSGDAEPLTSGGLGMSYKCLKCGTQFLVVGKF